MKFEELLHEESPLLKSIQERGFEIPSEIQEKTIPLILQGKDVVAGAATGSGKTLAFAAGLIKHCKKDHGIGGLVLTPTRELAEQITKELSDFSKYKNLNVLSVYGGVSMYHQVKRIPQAEIVVGTPGRILDRLEKRSIDFSHLTTLVLDEADRMFDMGFIDDVERILKECPIKRQTLLFSATISPEVVRLSRRYMKEPMEVSAEVYVDPKKLEQVYYDVDDNLKYSLLLHLLEHEKGGLVMIFCNTRKNVDFVSNNLKFMGMDVVPIHGGFSQEKRNRFLALFNNEKSSVRILVATDVAARGLDIKGVSHVYNYDIPLSPSEYTHRIGRTARAGKEGKVINLLSSRGYEAFQDIISNKSFNLKELQAPYLKRVMIRWMPERKQERTRRRSSMRHERESKSWQKEHSGRGRSGSRDGRSGEWRKERGEERGERSFSGGRSERSEGRSYGGGRGGRGRERR